MVVGLSLMTPRGHPLFGASENGRVKHIRTAVLTMACGRRQYPPWL
jgi:hypothetical protein